MYECLIDGGAELTQVYGCTGVGIEGRCGTCAHYHSGWDLAAAAGQPVRATCDGLVVAMGDEPGYGPYALFIQRLVDGLVELYGHLEDATVRPGDRVAAGQVIGHIGNEGNSTGPHLHWSIRYPEDRLSECPGIDPAPYLCSCRGGFGGPSPRGPGRPSLSGGAVLLLLGAGPRLGLSTSSPAAPDLGL